MTEAVKPAIAVEIKVPQLEFEITVKGRDPEEILELAALLLLKLSGWDVSAWAAEE